MKYKRILLKLSGEALMGDKQFGIDNKRLMQYAHDIKEIVDLMYKLELLLEEEIFLEVYKQKKEEWIEHREIIWEC